MLAPRRCVRATADLPIHAHNLALCSTRYHQGCPAIWSKQANVSKQANMFQNGHTSLRFCGILALLLAYAWYSAHAQGPARIVADSAGRRVEVPHEIARVLAAGPPASIL